MSCRGIEGVLIYALISRYEENQKYVRHVREPYHDSPFSVASIKPVNQFSLLRQVAGSIGMLYQFVIHKLQELGVRSSAIHCASRICCNI